MFVDADDQVSMNLIKTLVEDCEKNKADIAMSGYRECYGENQYIEKNCSNQIEIKTGKEILKEFYLSNCIGWNVWAKLYTAEVIGDTRFVVGKKNAEDMFFLYQVLKKTKRIVLHGVPLYNYIKQNDSAMENRNCDAFFDTFNLINLIYKDKESNEQIQTDKTVFYVNSCLWFFKFINIKDKEKKYKKKIDNARRYFLDNIENVDIKYNLKTKLQLKLFQHNYMAFRVLSMCWEWKNKKVQSKNKSITYKSLQNQLKREKKNYPNTWFDYISFNQRIYNWKFIKLLRKCEYFRYKTCVSSNPVWKGLYWIFRMRKNHLGVYIGVEIPEKVFDEGLIIHHNGNIVVNGSSKVGKNCQLHGDNCIGNSGKENELTKCPQIGNNVEIGVGAKVIGNITIADNIKIGANAVVTKSFDEEGITLVGIPARKLNHSL